MSFLSALGGDIKKVFNWLGSSKGQAVISTVETAVETVFPAADGAITVINSWLNEIFKTEALAQGALATPGTSTNTAKEAAVLAAVTPQLISFTEQYKLPAPTAATLTTINTALVTVLNTLSQGASSTATSSTNSAPTASTASPTTPSTMIAPTTGTAVKS